MMGKELGESSKMAKLKYYKEQVLLCVQGRKTGQLFSEENI